MQSPSRKRLSKNLLQMKFMKRTKEKQEQDMEHEERQNLFKHDITEAMKKHGNRFQAEDSYAKIADLVFGRMAFKGMNPEIEKMMDNQRLRKEEAEAAEKETEINDQTMAEHYGSLKNTIAKKFAGKKRSHHQPGPSESSKSVEELLNEGQTLLSQARQDNASAKKRKFMKPKD